MSTLLLHVPATHHHAGQVVLQISVFCIQERDKCQQTSWQNNLLGLVSFLAVTVRQQRTKCPETAHAHVMSSNLMVHSKLRYTGFVYKNRSASTHIC